MSIIQVLQNIKECPFYEDIESLILSHNQMKNAIISGSDQLPDFPQNIKVLDLSNNHFFDLHDLLSILPSKLECLYLQNNKFKGEFEWKLLPKHLKVLWIYGNVFEGAICWNQLPDSLNLLYSSKVMGDESMDTMPQHKWDRVNDDNFAIAVFEKVQKDSIGNHNAIVTVAIMLVLVFFVNILVYGQNRGYKHPL